MQKENRPSPERQDSVPEGFTLGLAIVDAIPVLEFSLSMIGIARRFRSALFRAGALCSTLAGCGKVLWKVLLACRNQNVVWLNRQFRYLMGGGFALMLASLVKDRSAISFSALWKRVSSFPARVFFLFGLAGMTAMGVMGRKLDKMNARHNWIEQVTNLFAQGMILLGIWSC